MAEKKTFLERMAAKVPDPVAIFAALYAIVFAVTVFFGGTQFKLPAIDPATGAMGEVVHTVKNMATRENLCWIFDNAIVRNWTAYAHGLIGILMVAMMGVGLAKASGLFSVLMKLAGKRVDAKLLPYVVVFAGIISNIASDAAYLVLIPLAGALYCAMGRNPLIGVAASFAGVSAGFGANLVPATTHDFLIGVPAKEFAVSQGVPWVSTTGAPLNEATMDYYYMAALVFVFTFLGGWITNRFVAPRLEKMEWRVPEDETSGDFDIAPEELRDLRWAALGLVFALAAAAAAGWGPLKGHFARNTILFVSFAFFCTGLAYGVARGVFRSVADVVAAMAKQTAEMAYMLVLTFFCTNFLAMLAYSEVGSWITYGGAKALLAMRLESSPVAILAGFVAMASLVNICIASMSAKWLLLGPIFIPMLYRVNSALTPEVVAAAYRTADPCTNVITPAMAYAGVILLFCRRYVKDFTLGDLGLTMLPYAAMFLVCATAVLLAWFKLGIPFGM